MSHEPSPMWPLWALPFRQKLYAFSERVDRATGSRIAARHVPVIIGLAVLIAVLVAVRSYRSSRGPLLAFGHMPGDMSYQGTNMFVSFPLGTSIFLSIALSVVMSVCQRRPDHR